MLTRRSPTAPAHRAQAARGRWHSHARRGDAQAPGALEFLDGFYRVALRPGERLGNRDQAVEDRAVERRAAVRRGEPLDRHDRRVDVAVAVEVEGAEDA